MSSDTVSRIANLKEIVGLLTLAFQAQREIADIIEDFDKRLYSLEQDRTRSLAAIRKLENENTRFRNQYSELLYKFSDRTK